MSQVAATLVGHVRDVIQPRKAKEPGKPYYGFILTEDGEKVFFHCRDLRFTWNDHPAALVNKVVRFEAVTTPPHEMRQAINIDIISGVAA